MSAPKWAPDNEAGLHAYVVEYKSWSFTTSRIEYAQSLSEARREHGGTRGERFASRTVRRAKPEDMPGGAP